MNSVVAIESNPTAINGAFVGTKVPRSSALHEMTIAKTGSFTGPLKLIVLIWLAAHDRLEQDAI